MMSVSDTIIYIYIYTNLNFSFLQDTSTERAA